MSVAMYERAQVQLGNAYYNLQKAERNNTIDDAYLDTACFNAH